jgi:C4-dicarboxylate transporter, DctM subunit
LSVSLLLILALAGVPLFAVIALAGFLGYWQAELDLSLVVMEFVGIAEHVQLTAVPLFAFCAVLIMRSRLPERLQSMQQSVAGFVALGGSLASLLIFILAGALTGVSSLLLTAIAATAWHMHGRKENLTRSDIELLSAGLSSGALIAPSAGLLLFAVAASQLAPVYGITALTLYLAGLLPAILIFAVLGVSALRNRQTVSPEGNKGGPFTIGWEIPLPFVVVGGIYSGFLDMLQAGLIASIWLFVSLVLIRREVSLAKLPDIISDAVVWSSATILLLGLSLVAAGILSDGGIPLMLQSMLGSLPGGREIFWLSAIGVMLIAGMFLDTPTATALIGPLLIPMGLAFGINPAQLAIVGLIGLQVGHLASPLGSLQATTEKRQGATVSLLPRPRLLFFSGLILILIALVFWPAATLWMTP